MNKLPQNVPKTIELIRTICATEPYVGYIRVAELAWHLNVSNGVLSTVPRSFEGYCSLRTALETLERRAGMLERRNLRSLGYE